MHEDVGSHEGGVSEQTSVDVVGLLACLVLERGRTLQLTEVSVHIEVEIELQHLTHVALHIDRSLLGIDTTRQVFGEDGIRTTDDIIGMRMSRQRMPVCDEEIAVILILHLREGTYSTEVVT